MNLGSEHEWLEKFDQSRPEKASRICKFLLSLSKNHSPIILDIGCNDGRMDEYYSQYTKELVIGIDISMDAIKSGALNIKKKGLDKIEFILADAQALPIREGKIDWIICAQTMEGLDNKEKLIHEFRRTLKREGLVYLSVISLMFFKLHRRFPRLFVPYLGLFYGRVYPSLKSPYGSPENYRYWTHIARPSALTITDVSADFILWNKSPIKRKVIKAIYRVFAPLSPSWVFILRHRELS